MPYDAFGNEIPDATAPGPVTPRATTATAVPRDDSARLPPHLQAPIVRRRRGPRAGGIVALVTFLAITGGVGVAINAAVRSGVGSVTRSFTPSISVPSFSTTTSSSGAAGATAAGGEAAGPTPLGAEGLGAALRIAQSRLGPRARLSLLRVADDRTDVFAAVGGGQRRLVSVHRDGSAMVLPAGEAQERSIAFSAVDRRAIARMRASAHLALGRVDYAVLLVSPIDGAVSWTLFAKTGSGANRTQITADAHGRRAGTS